MHVHGCTAIQVSLNVTLLRLLKADSHIACRSPATLCR